MYSSSVFGGSEEKTGWTVQQDPERQAKIFSDNDALCKWAFYRKTFIEFGKNDDFECMLKFVREGEDGYDDIAFADWEPESRHKSSWWLAAWWHHRYTRARDFWKDYLGPACLRWPWKQRRRPLDIPRDWNPFEDSERLYR